MIRQQNLNSRGGLELKYPVIVVGKVIAVHEGMRVDLAFLDGGVVRQVKVLSSFAGSFFGFSHMVAPTVDPTAYARETWRKTSHGSGDIFAQAAINLEGGGAGGFQPFSEVLPGQGGDGGDTGGGGGNGEGGDGGGTGGDGGGVGVGIGIGATPEGNGADNSSGQNNRDIYAVCMQCNGAIVGTARMFVLGFFYGYSEMEIPRDDQLQQFSDFMIVRHPSDVQMTIDKYANISVQHPSGARLTIGERSAIDASPVIDNPVDLTGRDLNGFYSIRNNLQRSAGVDLEDASASHLRMDGNQDILLENREEQDDGTLTPYASIHIDPNGAITATDSQGSTVVLDGGGNVTVHAVGGDIDVHADGNATVRADGDTTIRAQGNVIVNADGEVTVNGVVIRLN